MGMFSDQLRQVLRRLGRAPLFTIITLITLAVGVGANTVIFSVLEGVLLKPLPYPHPEQLIGVWHTAPGMGIPNLNMAPSIYFIDREQNTTFQDIGVYDGDSFSVTGAGEPEQVRGLDVSDGTLPMLGVRPALGRLFTREDDSPGTPDTVLLSYGYWRQKFGGATIGDRAIYHGGRKAAANYRSVAAGISFSRRRRSVAGGAVQVGPQQDETRQLQLRGDGASEAGSDDGAGERGRGAHAADRELEVFRRRKVSA